MQPGNFSQEGCLVEKMSAAGGPTRRRLLHDLQHDYYDIMSPVRPLF